MKLNTLTTREKVQNRKRIHVLQSSIFSQRTGLRQKDTYHLMFIWMTHYSMDYWETKLTFCEIFTVAFNLYILGGGGKKIKQHFIVNALQPTLTYIHNVYADKKNICKCQVKFTSIILSNYLTSHHMPLAYSYIYK